MNSSIWTLVMSAAGLLLVGSAPSAAQVTGRVLGSGKPITQSTVIPPESVSTLCGGQGVVIFYGMAKPVKSPQIGPARAP